MKTLLPLTAGLALIGSIALAQQGQPGAHFFESWDLNNDGQVTVAEATERRGDVFASFDENDDGQLTAEEYAAFDSARAAHHADNDQGQGQGQRQKPGQGMGRGVGMGGGQGRASVGMELAFNDIDGDGAVSRAEFLSKTKDWIALIDQSGDGIVTPADLGRG